MGTHELIYGGPVPDLTAADVEAASVFNVKAKAYGAKGDGASDDTQAIKAAVADAQSAGGGTVYLPPGNYVLTDRISLTAGPPLRILGAGAVMNDKGQTNATMLTASGSSVFFFSHTATLVSGFEIGDLAITYSGTGNVFDDVNLQSGYFHDLNVTVSSAGAGAFFTGPSETANNSVINCMFERIIVTTTAAARTAPAISFTSQNSGGISDVSFFKCKFNNNGGDTAQPAVLVACTATAGYHYATTFRDCYFEKPLGGAIKSLSGTGLLVDHCMFWDMNGSTPGASSVYIGAGSGGVGSQGVRILGCGRNRSSHDGTTTWDVECEATTSQVQIEGFHVLADSPSTATDAFINLNACTDVLLANNVSPQGATVNGNSTTVITNPSLTQVIISAGHVTSTA